LTFLRTWTDTDLQQPFDAAVVIPTILRPTLPEALESIFAQDLCGRIQVLLGIDANPCDADLIDEMCAARPPNVTVQLFWPGYSTSTRHGGVTPSHDGGALRTILTYMANSAYVAYLDDDNWWAPSHLSDLRRAVDGFDWAFSYRWFAHPDTRLPLAVDVWESGGPGEGVHMAERGGFVDPSCLMIDKTRCRSAPQCWTFPVGDDPMSADCTMFGYLSRHHSWRSTGNATAYYTLNRRDPMTAERIRWITELQEMAA
jgi:hypothetical protein